MALSACGLSVTVALGAGGLAARAAAGAGAATAVVAVVFAADADSGAWGRLRVGVIVGMANPLAQEHRAGRV